MAVDTNQVALPVVRDPKDFDVNSGDRLERIIFNNRIWVVVLCALVTLFMGWRMTKLTVNANFEEMIPQSHEFIQNYFANKDSVKGLGNAVRIVVETERGDIFDADYLEVVRSINDKIYLLPGVDRAMMRSLWMPIVRWTQITEEGAMGGPVMPSDYNGSEESLSKLRTNAMRAGLMGDLIGQDFKSSMIVVPLLDKVAETGKPLDYNALSKVLEDEVRVLNENRPAAAKTGPYKVRIVGFAKLVGDLIAGLGKVFMFFGVSALVATLLIFFYTRDWRSTLLLLVTAVCGVVWLLGLLQLLGYALNPYSILVPFLVFAIGISHGAQKMNGVMQDIGRGTHKYVAARYTFRRLFMAGLTALLTNVVGFAVLMIIDVPVIRDLALTTSMGVLILIFTKLFFIPVALSYIGVSPHSAQRSLREEGNGLMDKLWAVIERCTEKRYAVPLVIVSSLIGISAAFISLNYLKIGDLDAGAPELRPESRYNQDVGYINGHYGLSSDQFAVIMVTDPDRLTHYEDLVEMDRLVWELRQLPSVLSVNSLSEGARQMAMGMFEGNPKWQTLPRNTFLSSQSAMRVVGNTPGLVNESYSVAPVIAYLKDHRADTLDEVVKTVQRFAAEHNVEGRKFLLAAGSAGIEASTNIVVKQANYRMLALLYAAVVLLCFITFRSWRAVVVAMVPLLITAFLCEALMVWLNIGIKVATLPVIALGVGVGVDYALYLLSVQLAGQRQGMTLKESYRMALKFTGKVVALIGITMAAGVITWAYSSIKFQADMGILLTFMFVWNMVGALLLIPALSYFLLNPSRRQSTGDAEPTAEAIRA